MENGPVLTVMVQAESMNMADRLQTILVPCQDQVLTNPGRAVINAVEVEKLIVHPVVEMDGDK